MSSVSIGSAFYSGFIPLVKMGLSIAAGFIITKNGMFPVAASRGASQVAMRLSLPCLVFSSIVPSFNSSNIASLGPLIMSACIYQIIGAAMGFLIRELFYVPDDFRWGLIAACTCSNWGNLPTAVVSTVAENAPFDSSTDPTLGVAYVSIFILVYQITFFGVGLCKICAWDFIELPEEERNMTPKVRWARRYARYKGWRARRKGTPSDASIREVEGGDLVTPGTMDEKRDYIERTPTYNGTGGQLAPILSRYRSHHEAIIDAQTHSEPVPEGTPIQPIVSRMSQRSRRHVSNITQKEAITESPAVQEAGTVEERVNGKTEPMGDQEVEPERKSTRQIVLHALELIFTPITTSLIISLPIALVNPLKALFTTVDGWTGTRMPNAPDGNPPLSFILTTCTFLGDICIPLSLILLGSSLARIEIPRPISKLPWAAMSAVTIGKMVILPCIGVGMTISLSNNTTLFPKSDKILLFCNMFLSGSASAINQLLIAAIYSPTGKADTTAIFLGVQYLFMFVSSAALAAVAIIIVA